MLSAYQQVKKECMIRPRVLSCDPTSIGCVRLMANIASAAPLSKPVS